jgi:GNAT superfamily N-acetyltransferase
MLDLVDIKVDKTLPRVLEIVDILKNDNSEADVSDFSDWISEWDNITFVLALFKNRVIGFGILVNDSEAPLLDVLYVLPKYRSKGIGTKLVDKCKEIHTPLTLVANSNNAIRFYERSGFINKGVVYHMLGYGEHATALTYGE